jgi:DNA-binding LacI/PurR family transcriptional regulator
MAQGSFHFDSGLRAAEALLAHSNPPTAIFASNDDMAAAVLAVAYRPFDGVGSVQEGVRTGGGRRVVLAL